MDSRKLIRSRFLLWAGTAYLLFAMVMTLAGTVPELAGLFPDSVFKAFNPNDKTNLAPYRVIHFVIIAFFVTRFVPRNWKGLEWTAFRPAILCGQHSLEVFCFGIFLAFVAHFLLMLDPSLPMQFLVSFGGIGLLCILAYAKNWAARIDKKPKRAPEDIAAPARRIGPSILNPQPRDDNKTAA